jgi:hypothetical protein
VIVARNGSTWRAGPGQTQCVGMMVWVDGWQMQCCGDPFSVGSADGWVRDLTFTGYLVQLAD